MSVFKPRKVRGFFTGSGVLRAVVANKGWRIRLVPGIYKFHNATTGRPKFKLYIATVWVPVGEILGTAGKRMENTPYGTEIKASSGDAKALEACWRHLARKGWSETRIIARLERNKELIAKYNSNPDCFSVAVTPSRIPAQFIYFDGRHRGAIVENFSGPKAAIRARILLDGSLANIMDYWD